MKQDLTDMEKIKIDILRDAFKDTTDTIRALDRKIVFLISFNGIFLGLIATLFFKKQELEKIIQHLDFFYCILGLIGITWIGIFIFIMLGISPKSNPIDVFKSKEDKNFSNNIFYLTSKNGLSKESLSLDTLVTNYNKLNTNTSIEKLLYKEIGKVSYIRDKKLQSIQTSVLLTSIIIGAFSLFMIIFMKGIG